MKIDRVTEHAKRVIEGSRASGRLHRLACQRHLEDLKKQGTKEFPYKWDIKASQRIIDYAESLSLIEGTNIKNLKLLEEQAFDIGILFGWKNEKGFRRFRRSYKSMGRQNGKSTQNGIIGTYIGAFSGYNYGKLFTVATKKRQSRIAWEEMTKFIKADKELEELFTIKDYKSLIECKLTQCTIEALSKEAGLDDGFRSIFSSLDEIHQMKDNQIYKAIYNGTKALDETLVSMITTRGFKINSFCKEIDDYAVKILKGVVHAEDFFADIYTLDEDDDIWDPNNWFKANPFLATTEQGMKTLIQDGETAKAMGGMEQRDFIIKTLNMWDLHGEDVFMDLDKWHDCGSEKSIKDYKGSDVWIGLDLSSGGDLTTVHFEIDIDEDNSFHHSHSFMPRGRLEEHIETDVAPYDLWAEKELLTVTGGANTYKNDYKFIISYIDSIVKEYDLKIRGIGYDPHNADGFIQDLEKYGVPLLSVTQSARFLNDPTQDIRLSVKSGNVEYNQENELLSWSVANAKLVYNSFGEMKVDKEPRALNKRIDPVDAMIDARAVKMKFKELETIDLDNLTNSYLEIMGW